MRCVLAENRTRFRNDSMQFSRRVVSGTDGGRTGVPRSIIYHVATGGSDIFGFMTNNKDEILFFLIQPQDVI